ncbi:MAG: S8 family serine peptidase [Methylotenera sp.]|nr:S8 family serine peptidase [Oligoflexia bacterium]
MGLIQKNRGQFSGFISVSFAAALGAAAFTVFSGTASISRAASLSARSVPASVPGELIVKVRNSSGDKAQTQVTTTLQEALGGSQVQTIRSLKTDASLQKVKLADASKVGAAIEALKKNPSVAYAEPNYLMHSFDQSVELQNLTSEMDAAERHANGLPNDPQMAKLWGMVNTGQADDAGQVGNAGSDISVAPLWRQGITGSRNVVVAVIDTGIQWDHPDLVDNIYTNPGEAGELSNNGIDDDKNGFIDDVHGWNFNAHTRDSNDDYKHGTHCAGTIGAKGNNGIGISGVNWNVSMMPIKFLDGSGGGTLEGAIESINYATMMKVNVMSNSWGGGGFSQAMQDAVANAERAGILFVAAAGNDSSDNDTTPTYPASIPLPNVLAVAALDNRDGIANFSNYGTNTVHVAAPGVKIYSTSKEGAYETLSGTSMATPHVAGISALLLSANPTLGYAELKSRLIRTSQPVPSLKRKVQGHGRVSASNAFNNIVPPSNEPDEKLWVDQAVSIESPHPYENNMNKIYGVSVPGAKYLRVVFDEVNTESGYDVVSVESPTGAPIDSFTGRVSNKTSEYYQGDSVVIRLKSDVSNSGYGFRVSKVQVIK